jgi:hypothetical protein
MATDAAPEPTPSAGVHPSVITPGDPTRPRRLSEEFDLIVREFEVETVTLREVFTLLHGRGYVLLMMMLALPFCTPVPLPGLSTPLGLIIGIIALRLALGQKPWLPAKLLDTRLPPALFKRVFIITRRIISWFERVLRPRWLWLTAPQWSQQLHAVPVFLCAALLLLPLPVPFSNTIPAWAIMLMAAGLLERDGLFILGGHLASLAAFAFFGAIGIFGIEVFDVIERWALSLFR